MFGIPDYILAGLAGGLIMMGWGAWSWIVDLFHTINFRFYLARVRACWMTVTGTSEDIVDMTGEACWLQAYDDGLSPKEAIFNGIGLIA